jgi:hypothetical protein
MKGSTRTCTHDLLETVCCYSLLRAQHMDGLLNITSAPRACSLATPEMSAVRTSGL